MNACIDPAVNRYRELEDVREEFRKTLVAYRNLYAFLAQIIPFQNSDLGFMHSQFPRTFLHQDNLSQHTLCQVNNQMLYTTGRLSIFPA